MNVFIDSNISIGQYNDDIAEHAKTEIVKNEPMLFSCDKNACEQLGGPLTKHFLKGLSQEFLDSEHLIVDSRVHMLMKGWFPAIPGHHHDSVPRTREDKQPNYNDPQRSKHCMMLVSENDTCPTEFALGSAEFPEVPLGQIIYKTWHQIVENMLNRNELMSFHCPFNRYIYFDDRAWHQATASNKNGWRWFIRASIDPTRKPSNELRRQVQVYLENPMEGW